MAAQRSRPHSIVRRTFLKLLRDPFVQFLLAGAALYILFTITGTDDPAVRDRQITLDASTLEWIHGNFSKQFRRAPTHDEMGTLVRTHIEHEVKYREALSIGLDDRDTIVQRRLIQKFDFLFGDAAAQIEPDDRILQTWYDEHHEGFSIPATITFTHHWFSPDRRQAAEEDARAAAAALNAGEIARGDSFPFDTTFSAVRDFDVRRVFGQDFVDTVFAAAIDTWVGPVSSGLGYHAVRITARTPIIVPPLAEIREAVLQEWRRAESRRILERIVRELVGDYAVTVDKSSLEALEYSAEAP